VVWRPIFFFMPYLEHPLSTTHKLRFDFSYMEPVHFPYQRALCPSMAKREKRELRHVYILYLSLFHQHVINVPRLPRPLFNVVRNTTIEMDKWESSWPKISGFTETGMGVYGGHETAHLAAMVKQ
jgi:hypothetical protein